MVEPVINDTKKLYVETLLKGKSSPSFHELEARALKGDETAKVWLGWVLIAKEITEVVPEDHIKAIQLFKEFPENPMSIAGLVKMALYGKGNLTILGNEEELLHKKEQDLASKNLKEPKIHLVLGEIYNRDLDKLLQNSTQNQEKIQHFSRLREKSKDEYYKAALLEDGEGQYQYANKLVAEKRDIKICRALDIKLPEDDFNLAEKFYKLAIEQGVLFAKNNLGKRIYERNGRKDEALRLFREAGQSGDIYGMRYAAVALIRKSLPEIVEAFDWLNKANKPGKDKRSEILNELQNLANKNHD